RGNIWRHARAELTQKPRLLVRIENRVTVIATHNDAVAIVIGRFAPVVGPIGVAVGHYLARVRNTVGIAIDRFAPVVGPVGVAVEHHLARVGNAVVIAVRRAVACVGDAVGIAVSCRQLAAVRNTVGIAIEAEKENVAYIHSPVAVAVLVGGFA